ncbi:MAG: xanthine dehydrogenase family protein subunit M [Gemmatimonadota bacterium]
MRSAVSGLELRTPDTLGEALEMLAGNPSLVPLAGGTDVYVDLQFGTAAPAAYMDISGLEELRFVEERGDVLALGGGTTFAAILRSEAVLLRLPMLVEAAATVGGAQIQAAATVGGNIANASPAGDSLPVFAAADATLVLRSASGERRVPFNDFYTGYRETRLGPGELIVAVEVPPVRGPQWYRKVGTRAAQAISKVVMAAVRARRPRVAFGSVAPTPVRATHAEEALASGAGAAEVRAALARDISPIDDVRSTASYRLAVAGNLLLSWWEQGEAG